MQTQKEWKMEPVIAAQGLVKRYGEVVAVARYDEQGPGVDGRPSNDWGRR